MGAYFLEDTTVTEAIIQLHQAIIAHEKSHAGAATSHLIKCKASLNILLIVGRLLETCDELEFMKLDTEAEYVHQNLVPLLQNVSTLMGDMETSELARTLKQIMHRLTNTAE